MNRGSDLDKFNPNIPQNQDDRGRNDFFANRGGHVYSGGRSNNYNGPHYNNTNYGYRRNNQYGDAPNFNRDRRPPHFNNYERGPRPYYNN